MTLKRLASPFSIFFFPLEKNHFKRPSSFFCRENQGCFSSLVAANTSKLRSYQPYFLLFFLLSVRHKGFSYISFPGGWRWSQLQYIHANNVVFQSISLAVQVRFWVLLHYDGFCNNCTPKWCLHIQVHFQTNAL